jgi:hypothetical protein
LNCPVECPENNAKPFDRYRSKFCDDCPNKRAKDNFKKRYYRQIGYRFGENEKRFRFETMLDSLYGLLNSEDLPPDKMSAKTSRRLSVYRAEKYRAEKLAEENKPTG